MMKTMMLNNNHVNKYLMIVLSAAQIINVQIMIIVGTRVKRCVNTINTESQSGTFTLPAQVTGIINHLAIFSVHMVYLK